MTTSESDAQKALPTFPAERLSSFGVEVLTDLLHLHEDRLPLTVIDECASRGEAIVDALAAMADDPTYWDDDVGAGEWWALFHAVLILGRIPGERAAAALLAFMHRMDATDDDNLQEWLDGCWPALFANKPPETLERLRGFALERSRQWYMRLQALDVVVAAAEREGQATLDAALDWAAALAADETENWDFRLMSAMTVLSFAPPRHRALLEALARRQSRREAAFNIQDVEETYGGEPMPPDSRDRDDPWSFYQPEAIAERQRRWAELEAEEAEDDAAPVAPYVRETPKTGRNDPCPCGSGKKFKHCCMNG